MDPPCTVDLTIGGDFEGSVEGAVVEQQPLPEAYLESLVDLLLDGARASVCPSPHDR